MSSNLLTSLAILMVNWSHGYDYIENFVPFVIQCFHSNVNKGISLLDVKQEMNDKFKLNIPLGALATILKRTARRGFIRKSHGIYIRTRKSADKYQFQKRQDSVLRQHNQLVRKFQEFLLSEFNVDWKKEKAEEALYTILDDQSSIILSTVITGNPLNLSEFAEEDEEKYLAHKFVLFLHEFDEQGFNYLETLIKGSILANAVIFPNINKISKGLENVDFYLDTTIILRALQLSNKGLVEATLELIELVKKTGGNLNCFNHTIKEIEGILDSSAKNLRQKRPGNYETLNYLIERNMNAGDVERIIASLQHKIKSLDITSENTPEFNPQYVIDEKAFEKYIDDAVGYKNTRTRDKDVASISAIFRLRQGRFPNRMESCRVMFVTTNSTLSNATVNFFRENYSECIIPLCITDHALTTLVWLKNPSLYIDLPRKQLLANCFAALQPSDEQWDEYIKQVYHLTEQGKISEDENKFLIFSSEVKTLLMDTIHGSSDVFSEGTILDVLNKAKANIQAEKNSEIKKVKEDKNQIEKELLDVKDNLRILVNRIVNSFIIVIKIIFAIIIGFCIYKTFPYEVSTKQISFIKLIAFILLLAGCIITFFDTFKGNTVEFLTEKLESYLKNRLLKMIKRIIKTDI